MKKKYFAVYTAIFCLIAAAVFQTFWRHGITLIHVDDGWVQHYKALVYYAQWWRSILRTLFTQHRLVIPQWSASIGYGSDIITTLSYYVMGDPLNLLSVAVPTRYMAYCYSFLMVLRLYLAGLAFSSYCKYMGKKNDTAILAGAICYVFCGYALFGAIKHPFFLNPMIYFPLILTGVEKVMKRQSPLQLTLSVGLSAFSNFYFFYMLVIFTVLYVCLRVITCYKRTQIREAACLILRIGVISFIGVLISGILLVPTLNAFLSDQRTGVSTVFDLFYKESYYRNLLTSFVTSVHAGSWTYMGYSILSVMVIFLLFLRKGRRQLKTAFLFCTGLLLLPEAGYLLNGASYVSNRWIWVYSFVIALILVFVWDDLFHLKKREYLLLPCLIVAYFIADRLLDQKHVFYMQVNAIVAVLALVILLGHRWLKTKQKKAAQYLLAAVAGFGIICMANLGYSQKAGSFVDEFKELSQVSEQLPGRTDAMMKNVLSGDEKFTRFTGPDITWNSTLYSGLHNTQFYWSISNPSVSDLMHRMQINEPVLWMYKGLDDRTALEALASVGYYICSTESELRVPYGFEQIWEGDNGYRIYKNKYALPLGYTYTSAVSESDTEDLDALQLQNRMLDSVVLENGAENYPAGKTEENIADIPYELTCTDGVTLENNCFTVTEKKAKAVLTFDGEPNSETYLKVTNLDYQGKKETTALTIFCSDETQNTVKKTLNYFTNRYRRYAGKKDFLINLNYSESKKTQIVISFPEKGTYSFDKINILCQNMDSYTSQIEGRKESVLEDEQMNTNEIKGRISLDQDKFLCLSIPYSAGWTAYVDGTAQKIRKANLMYMGVDLTSGEHEITFVYHTPYLRIGAAVSIFGAVMLVFMMMWYQRTKRAVTKEKRG